LNLDWFHGFIIIFITIYIYIYIYIYYIKLKNKYQNIAYFNNNNVKFTLPTSNFSISYITLIYKWNNK